MTEPDFVADRLGQRLDIHTGILKTWFKASGYSVTDRQVDDQTFSIEVTSDSDTAVVTYRIVTSDEGKQLRLEITTIAGEELRSVTPFRGEWVKPSDWLAIEHRFKLLTDAAIHDLIHETVIAYLDAS